jgi:hypothetical protein
VVETKYDRKDFEHTKISWSFKEWRRSGIPNEPSVVLGPAFFLSARISSESMSMPKINILKCFTRSILVQRVRLLLLVW